MLITSQNLYFCFCVVSTIKFYDNNNAKRKEALIVLLCTLQLRELHGGGAASTCTPLRCFHKLRMRSLWKPCAPHSVEKGTPEMFVRMRTVAFRSKLVRRTCHTHTLEEVSTRKVSGCYVRGCLAVLVFLQCTAFLYYVATCRDFVLNANILLNFLTVTHAGRNFSTYCDRLDRMMDCEVAI